ncbi:DUF1254 domain-containing protein [Galbibacter mesophilus]|uniref:DUF1254 domain-containing protein n=1 Tax=Galbibacter mesophilus TaxID=379069 RepID=UPI00191F4EB0|nr:DUF1254 domain-containing protein [Galbibacter mesophilus]MCM5662488.1 DUF1254 domain-containing protein [Galbibacter mesophilus]
MKTTFLSIAVCFMTIVVTSCKQQKKEGKTTTEDTVAATEDNKVSVTKDNFARAMCDLAMQKEFAQGGDNAFNHHRKPMPLDEQPAPLMNRDTNYSFAILDGRGDVAITLPETDGRYMSLHVMNHDHVTAFVYYGPGRYVIPADKTTDFFYANVRIQIDASDPDDVKKVNDYQDQLKIEFLNGYQPKSFQVTNWNMEEFEQQRKHYVKIAQEEGVRGTMGTLDDPVSTEDRNRGVAIATGLLPDEDAVYFTERYDVEKDKTYKVTYQVPEMRDEELGFYSVTIYGADQHLKTDEGSIISNDKIKLNPDGKTFDLYYVPQDQFAKADYANKVLVPSKPFWICFRVYIPSESVIDGGYVLPEVK